MRHNNTVVKMVKYGIERVSDVPVEWPDEKIDAYLSMWGPITNATIWCDYDETLFDNPHIIKDYIENPIQDGYRRIRVAHEEFIHLKLNRFASEEELNKTVTDEIRWRCFGSGYTFIWCWGDEELFKE